jgi:hypothetical protein
MLLSSKLDIKMYKWTDSSRGKDEYRTILDKKQVPQVKKENP